MTQAIPASDDFHDSEASPERRLMMAVLLTAILDAAGKSDGTVFRNRDIVQASALGWIKDGGQDFLDVCHLAGVDPHHVRRRSLDFIDSGKPMPRMRRHSTAKRIPIDD